MAEYIEREPLLESLRESYETLKLIRNELKYEKAIALEDAQLITFMECILRVKEQPTADVVEVVFCERCKDYEPHGNGKAGVCRNKKCTGLRHATDYCSCGERRCEE